MSNHKPDWDNLLLTRREALRRVGMGFGALAFTGLYGETLAPVAARAADALDPLAEKAPPLPSKAKHVIHIFQSGGPSHIDTFDPKPMLAKYRGQQISGPKGKEGLGFPSPFAFKKHGQSGIEVSELYPHLGAHVDEMAIIRSMVTDNPAHETSLMLMNTGVTRFVRPSVGAWTLYGLGTQNQSLPGFVAMSPGGYPLQGAQNWGVGFLPAIYEGVFIDPEQTDVDRLIEHLRNQYASREEQRQQLDLLHEIDAAYKERVKQDSAMEARIRSFELAYDMQQAATEAFDIGKEPESIRKLYGEGPQARQMLIARRLVERGVRFVQCWQGGWDTHANLTEGMRTAAKECDQPIAALLQDLKQRGLLESTLVVCGGEFGRTPTAQLPGEGVPIANLNGRDHNNQGFTVWMAGGGVKGGYVHGATDALGFAAVKDKVHVHDLHATILRLLGFDHEKFTYRYAGRDFRLTDVYGSVVKALIA